MTVRNPALLKGRTVVRRSTTQSAKPGKPSAVGRSRGGEKDDNGGASTMSSKRAGKEKVRAAVSEEELRKRAAESEFEEKKKREKLLEAADGTASIEVYFGHSLSKASKK